MPPKPTAAPRATYTASPFPAERELTVEGGRLAAHKHTITALVEVDVTRARSALREHKARTGEGLSFTAFVLTCLGRAVEEHKAVHALRDWRNRLIVFDDVDINVSVEVERAGRKVVLPHLIRAANRQTLSGLHADLRAAQTRPEQTRAFRLWWFVRLPRWVRAIFYWFVYKNPAWLKAGLGTVGLTAVGMFGTGGGWAIPFNVHSLNVALGGIAEKPVLVDGRLAVSEFLCVTLLFDHDVIDGGPAARFTQRFRELLESGYGLCEPGPAAEPLAGPPGMTR